MRGNVPVVSGGDPPSVAATPTSGSAGWYPINSVQQRMAQALASGDTLRYFAALHDTPLYLPAYLADDTHSDDTHGRGGSGGDARGRVRRVVTVRRDGVTYLPAFTSVTYLGRATGDALDGYRTATLAQLAESWPDPAWQVAIDLDTPIAMSGPITEVVDAVTQAASIDEEQRKRPDADAAAPAPNGTGGVLPDIPAGENDIFDDFQPANEIERLMAEAIAVEDREAFLDAMIVSTVLVVVPTVAALGTPAPTEPRVPTSAADRRSSTDPRSLVGDDNTISVFTSLERLLEVYPVGCATHTADLVALVRIWPAPSVGLIVNRGSEIMAAFDGPQVALLLPWAQWLVQRRFGGVSAAPPPPPLPGAATRPLARGRARVRTRAEGSARVVAKAGGRARVRMAASLLEIAVRDEDLQGYLRDGWNRVTGTVRAAGEGGAEGERDTDGLVIRWNAHCPALYQEPTVRGILLPHGAQLQRINGGVARPVATYDADIRRWIPAETDVRSGLAAGAAS